MSDSDVKKLLWACAKSGSDSDWEEFHRRFGSRLRTGVLRAFNRQGARPLPETIEDLVQETYCKLFEHDARILQRCRSDEEIPVASYLARVAERVALDHLRAQAAAKRGGGRVDSLERIAEREGEGPWMATPAVAETRLLNGEVRRRFLESCRRVAGRRRARNLRILRLAFLEGLTSREISQQLENLISPNGIDTLLHRVRRRLAAQGFLVPRRGTAVSPS